MKIFGNLIDLRKTVLSYVYEKLPQFQSHAKLLSIAHKLVPYELLQEIISWYALTILYQAFL